jgi:hypothetical protein
MLQDARMSAVTGCTAVLESHGEGRLWAVSERSCWNLYALRISILPWQCSRFAGKVYWRFVLYWLNHKMGNEIVDENEAKIEGRLHGEQIEPEQPDNMLQRFIYMLLIAIMISLAQTVLGVATVVQFVIMLINKKQPNERLADFGSDLGIWIAKAARFQTAASNVKPWPWTELD